MTRLKEIDEKMCRLLLDEPVTYSKRMLVLDFVSNAMLRIEDLESRINDPITPSHRDWKASLNKFLES